MACGSVGNPYRNPAKSARGRGDVFPFLLLLADAHTHTHAHKRRERKRTYSPRGGLESANQNGAKSATNQTTNDTKTKEGNNEIK